MADLVSLRTAFAQALVQAPSGALKTRVSRGLVETRKAFGQAPKPAAGLAARAPTPTVVLTGGDDAAGAAPA